MNSLVTRRMQPCFVEVSHLIFITFCEINSSFQKKCRTHFQDGFQRTWLNCNLVIQELTSINPLGVIR